MVAVTLALELLLMNLIGMSIRKAGIVKEDFAQQVTSLLMKICLPCLIFRSVSQATEVSVESLRQCGVVIVIAALVMGLSLMLGQILYVLTGRSGFGRILRYGLCFTHYSFMGIPVIQALYGDIGLFYYSFFLIPARIMYFSLSESLITPPGSSGGRRSASAVLRGAALNPCLLAVFAGLVFWICGWRLPTIIDYCVRSFSTISTPMALLLCGMVLAEYDLRKLLHARYFLLPCLRTIAMPLLFLLLTLPLGRLGVEDKICQITVLFTAMPVASLLPVYTVRYDPDRENQLTAAAATFLSVLMSIVTVPIFYALLLQ